MGQTSSYLEPEITTQSEIRPRLSLQGEETSGATPGETTGGGHRRRDDRAARHRSDQDRQRRLLVVLGGGVPDLVWYRVRPAVR